MPLSPPICPHIEPNPTPSHCKLKCFPFVPPSPSRSTLSSLWGWGPAPTPFWTPSLSGAAEPMVQNATTQRPWPRMPPSAQAYPSIALAARPPARCWFFYQQKIWPFQKRHRMASVERSGQLAPPQETRGKFSPKPMLADPSPTKISA